MEATWSPGRVTVIACGHNVVLALMLKWLPQESMSVGEFPERHSLISVPHPFIIAGGRFREFYYW